MFLTHFLVIFIATLFFLAYARKYHGNKNAWPSLPPGPVGVPVLGYLPFLDVLDLGGSFSKLSRKYGDVFSLKVQLIDYNELMIFIVINHNAL